MCVCVCVSPSLLDEWGWLYQVLFLSQNITFEGFDVAVVLAVDVDTFEEKAEGGEEEDEPTDNSPWANSDRDYTYEEVGII